MAANGFDFLSQGISSIFGGVGDAAEASAYGKAAKIAQTNEVVAQESGNIQTMQMNRKIYQTLGAQQAAYGGAGVQAGAGSGGDVYRSSVQQGALSKQLIATQTALNVGSFAQEAAAYTGMANAAKAASGGGFLSGLVSVAGAALSFLSDSSAKTDINRLGPSRIKGIDLYLFRYIGSGTIFKGVIAEEVASVRPDCVYKDPESGLWSVDYLRLGIPLEEVRV